MHEKQRSRVEILLDHFGIKFTSVPTGSKLWVFRKKNSMLHIFQECFGFLQT